MIRFYLARLQERLWLKPLISCILSLFAVFVAELAQHVELAESFPDISAESLETLLSIMSASMLVIAVFAVGSMLSAYSSASRSATPRSFLLVVGDDVSQNALSTFIGAFIFSIVALLAILNGFYGQPGRFVLFLVTIFVFTLVILGFVRWVDRIARLGQLGNTIDKVESATDAALKTRAQMPTLGAARAMTAEKGDAVYPETVGYVQNIDIAKLQHIAEQVDGRISVCVLPGTFVTPGSPLAFITAKSGPDKDGVKDTIVEAFVIGKHRTFESDPRFGLIVLSEIGSRALSPAVNDPGTAIDIVGTLVRLFVRWARVSEEEDVPIKYDRISIPAISLNDMFDDAFNAIARDGAASVEVAIRLQKAFGSLVLVGHDELKKAAGTHAALAFRHAERSLALKEELDAVQALAERNAKLAGEAPVASPGHQSRE
ncbi:DUF2254 domain-containing protein [Kineobactrum salinum]|nr:DUF2254 domain-containing protein [Kineobactrum salinum]